MLAIADCRQHRRRRILGLAVKPRRTITITVPDPKTAPNSGRWLARALLPLLVIASLVLWLKWPVEPLHARRDALPDHLRALAAEVNAYKKRTGSFPQSLKDVALLDKDGTRLSASGYRLAVRPDQSDFLVVADHVFKDATGEFYFAADENLQIQKVPASDDPPQDPAAGDQGDGTPPSPAGPAGP
jgi:hypothetical protein